MYVHARQGETNTYIHLRKDWLRTICLKLEPIGPLVCSYGSDHDQAFLFLIVDSWWKIPCGRCRDSHPGIRVIIRPPFHTNLLLLSVFLVVTYRLRCGFVFLIFFTEKNPRERGLRNTWDYTPQWRIYICRRVTMYRLRMVG